MTAPTAPTVPGARPPRRGIAFQVTVLTTVVAAVAVLVAALVSYPLIRSGAVTQAADTLSRQADLVAAAAEREGANPATPQVWVRLLRRQGIEAALVPRQGPVPPGVSPGDAQAIRAGDSVSRIQPGDPDVLVEGRPLANGRGIVLAQPVTEARAAESIAVRRLLVALVVGLLIAGLAGWLLARRLARPLAGAAAAAHRLAAGERDVRVEPEGPAEVADLASAMNRLSAALAASEGRQRDFLLSVSHELRTPLTAVQGYAEALADGTIPPDEAPRVGAVVRDEAKRLDRLVTDLLDLARLQAQEFRLEPTVVDLGALVRQAGEVWQARGAAVGVDLRLEVGDEVLAWADPVRVRQALDGLAENALRVTPADRPIVFATRAEGGGAVLEVRDGGPGLSDADLAVAFERGVLHDRYRGVRPGGSGVGLALVAGLVARLGGRCEAGHAPEGGACFALWLPAPRASSPERPPAGSSAG